MRQSPQLSPALITLIALLSAVAPLGTDLYLSTFTDMSHEFKTTPAAVQLTLTTFLIGLAVGQLAFGPWSDRVGRRTPLLIGLSAYVVAGVVAVLAPSIAVLIIARAVQGFAGASGMVLGRAIIADLASGKQAASAFSLVMVVGGVAPVVGPFVGSALATPLGWRGLLGIVAAIGLIGLIASIFIVKETLPAYKRLTSSATAHEPEYSPSAPHDGQQDISTVPMHLQPSLRHNHVFWSYTLALALGFSVLMTYISASPFLYQTVIGFSHFEYGVCFGINAIGLVAVSAISARAIHHFPARRLLALGMGVALFGSLAFFLLTLTAISPVIYTIPIFFTVSALGLVFGNATALAMGAIGQNAGLASAVLGCVQFGLGAAVSPLATIAGATNPIPTAVAMLLCAIGTGCAIVLGNRSQSSQLS